MSLYTRNKSDNGATLHCSLVLMLKFSLCVLYCKNVAQKMAKENRIKLLGKPVGLSPNLAATIAKKVVTIAIKKSIGLGMEI